MLPWKGFLGVVLLFSIAIAFQDRNICGWITCANNGTCEQFNNNSTGFRCRCEFGFTGVLCEERLNITTCVTNPCRNNGNCTITSERRVKCNCPARFTGSRCEVSV